MFSSPMAELISNKLSIIVENGLPVEYYCPLQDSQEAVAKKSDKIGSRALSDLNTHRISFFYEISIANPMESIMEEFIEQDLPTFEYAILYMVAKSTYLLKCDFTRQDIKLWANNVSVDSNSPPPYLASLSSNPHDSWSNDASK